MKTRTFSVTLLTIAFAAQAALAAVIGTNTPAQPLTPERVAGKPDWQAYLEKSLRQRRADQDFFRAEMIAAGMKQSTEPKAGKNPAGAYLGKPSAWFASPEARRIAENLVSFQTPAGGWCKNSDLTSHKRAPGEMFGAETGSLFLGTNDFDKPKDQWSYVGTFDNNETTTELTFLAKVISQNESTSAELKKAFLHGLDYIFSAQYPNGGWPQVWPLQGGYHDAITLNDQAATHILELLNDVSGGQAEFAFVPADVRAKAGSAFKRGLTCVLDAQIKVGGRLTVWCQQHDPLTLAPTAARNYEMPSQSTSESGTLVLFLLRLPEPDERVVAAVHAACAWFEKTRIMGKKFASTATEGRKLQDVPGAGPIWARFYEIGTDRPIFGDRDQTIHDDVNEISRERRKGYSWFGDTPKRVLQHYAKWSKKHPQQ